MKCFCEQKERYCLKVEADLGADPIWCNECKCNFDLEDVPISDELKDELNGWILGYGAWIDWSRDKVFPDAINLEEKHNKIGEGLTEKVKKELGKDYKIFFSPANITENYPK